MGEREKESVCVGGGEQPSRLIFCVLCPLRVLNMGGGHFLSHRSVGTQIPPHSPQKGSKTKLALRSRDGRSPTMVPWSEPEARLWRLADPQGSMAETLGERAFVKYSFDEERNINTNCYYVSF